ncbi:yeats-domain-containing protein [Aureobasidium sp. EXF-10728]|nr:yeats-domain-containing protein [Aureobasidium sp. EXF-10728]
MPAAASNKRVKNTRISRPFIIGSQAWNLNPTAPQTDPIPEGHTKGWRVYVKALDSGPDLSTWLKKVQFKLHMTYADPSRTVEAPPFQIQETGYGEFDIEMRLYFDSSSGEKAQYRSHRLRLEPYGSEEQQKMQKETNMVTSETCEIVEFNEPSHDFFAKMTAEDQFAHLQKKGGGAKGGRGAKGRGARIEYEGGREPTANLPDRGSDALPWSRELEKKMLDMLSTAQKDMDAEIDKEKQKAEDRRKRLQEIA